MWKRLTGKDNHFVFVVFYFAPGGHLDVVQLLVHAGADIDSQDNRKVSCLMAAFRKVNHTTDTHFTGWK